MKIKCCGCDDDVEADLVKGSSIYTGWTQLYEKQFWKCPVCKNYVGCHPGTEKPLGSIPTKELRTARGHIHKILDPLWKGGQRKRGSVYAELSRRLGYSYHSGEVSTIEEARKIYRIIQEMRNEAGSVEKTQHAGVGG